TLTDQYGSGVGSRETIRFESTDPSVMPNGTDRTTNVGGVATLEYRRDSDSGAAEGVHPPPRPPPAPRPPGAGPAGPPPAPAARGWWQ
ncbi:MAG: hypothetical protein OXD34_07980, partial [bacterium]|nr:hypothetical protein [bacterium]